MRIHGDQGDGAVMATPDPVLTSPVLTNPLTTADPGYVYRLLREMGLSDFGARTGQFLLVGPLRIMVILMVSLLVARWGGAVLRRTVTALRLRAPMRRTTPRMEQRARTIGEVAANGWRAAVFVIASLMVLSELGLNLIPLLAGASIAGIAIGLGAQSLIRDFLSGLFILAEDQFGVGDVITVGAVSGSVEELSLRVTRLRSADGTVWFLPNGDIRQLGNQSMEWSMAIVDVSIGYDNDLPAVLLSLTAEAERLRAESLAGGPMADDLLEVPEVQGSSPWGLTASRCASWPRQRRGGNGPLLANSAPGLPTGCSATASKAQDGRWSSVRVRPTSVPHRHRWTTWPDQS